jgi:glycosyltransferase involved in cell wall biosynthesis
VLYVGRIDVNKGCAELFDYFQQYARRTERALDLVLIGTPILPVPAHPQIRHLGYVSDQDKYDVLAGAEALVMPSYFESLSMVALEAWALGKPVLANGRCDVLRGQCIRSNAGLYYDSYEEFVEALYSLESNGPLNARLGRNGRDFFKQHYAWPVIERKYLDMFGQLGQGLPPKGGSHAGAGHAVEPLPGWFARRKRDLPPSQEVLERIPRGPALQVPTERDLPPLGGSHPVRKSA